MAAGLRRYGRTEHDGDRQPHRSPTPSCFARGVNGGTKIRGIKMHLGVEKSGILPAIDASPANLDDTTGVVPVLRELAGHDFKGATIGDLGYRGERLA
ncbi:transposase [Azospirillum canadense]|uniref:transposase n=1 Tax=Azospirillum canadense TaxID=403962 RepID=UPI002226CD80|nr:transposase [Azospirillum canadense]MCW2240561.1 hypothetical protein [Azospirillum canadense]